MGKFLKLVLAATVLTMILGSAVYATLPSWGTIYGDTWTATVGPHRTIDPGFSYSITPVPGGSTVLGYHRLTTLTLGSVITMLSPDDELRIAPIIYFDYTESSRHGLGHELGDGFFARTHTFNVPGRYLVAVKREIDNRIYIVYVHWVAVY